MNTNVFKEDIVMDKEKAKEIMDAANRPDNWYYEEANLEQQKSSGKIAIASLVISAITLILTIVNFVLKFVK